MPSNNSSGIKSFVCQLLYNTAAVLSHPLGQLVFMSTVVAANDLLGVCKPEDENSGFWHVSCSFYNYNEDTYPLSSTRGWSLKGHSGRTDEGQQSAIDFMAEVCTDADSRSFGWTKS